MRKAYMISIFLIGLLLIQEGTSNFERNEAWEADLQKAKFFSPSNAGEDQRMKYPHQCQPASDYFLESANIARPSAYQDSAEFPEDAVKMAFAFDAFQRYTKYAPQFKKINPFELAQLIMKVELDKEFFNLITQLLCWNHINVELFGDEADLRINFARLLDAWEQGKVSYPLSNDFPGWRRAMFVAKDMYAGAIVAAAQRCIDEGLPKNQRDRLIRESSVSMIQYGKSIIHMLIGEVTTIEDGFALAVAIDVVVPDLEMRLNRAGSDSTMLKNVALSFREVMEPNGPSFYEEARRALKKETLRTLLSYIDEADQSKDRRLLRAKVEKLLGRKDYFKRLLEWAEMKPSAREIKILWQMLMRHDVKVVNKVHFFKIARCFINKAKTSSILDAADSALSEMKKTKFVAQTCQLQPEEFHDSSSSPSLEEQLEFINGPEDETSQKKRKQKKRKNKKKKERTNAEDTEVELERIQNVLPSVNIHQSNETNASLLPMEKVYQRDEDEAKYHAETKDENVSETFQVLKNPLQGPFSTDVKDDLVGFMDWRYVYDPIGGATFWLNAFEPQYQPSLRIPFNEHGTFLDNLGGVWLNRGKVFLPHLNTRLMTRSEVAHRKLEPHAYWIDSSTGAVYDQIGGFFDLGGSYNPNPRVVYVKTREDFDIDGSEMGVYDDGVARWFTSGRKVVWAIEPPRVFDLIGGYYDKHGYHPNARIPFNSISPSGTREFVDRQGYHWSIEGDPRLMEMDHLDLLHYVHIRKANNLREYFRSLPQH